jgi:subtilisin
MRLLLSVCFCAAVLVLAGCSESNAPVTGPSDQTVLYKDTQESPIDVSDSWIVILSSEPQRDHRASAARLENEIAALHARVPMRVTHRYTACLRGFAARMSDAAAAALAKNPNVERIERDGIATIDAQTLPTGINRIDADLSPTASITTTGGDLTGVQIYIIDTGINAHPDLNLAGGRNFVPSGKSTNPASYGDGNGHGTHVAGTAAARDNTSYVVGVAPGAPVYAVRVLNNSGSGAYSWIIAGVDWVMQQKLANNGMPMVANMSLGGPPDAGLDQAIVNACTPTTTPAYGGVTFCVAAGNEGTNASQSSPARVPEAITVGSYNPTNNAFSYFSNYGSVVDILAPGENILSTSRSGKTTTMSGTSMASPHVAGAAALYLKGNTGASPAQVSSALKAAAVNNSNSTITLNANAISTQTTNLSVYVKTF